LIYQIEKVSVNLHIEYGDKVVKLINSIQDPEFIKFIKENIVKLPILDKAIDLNTRNNINKKIYLDTIKCLYTKLQNKEGDKLINNSFNSIFNLNNSKSYKNTFARSPTSSKSPKSIRKNNHMSSKKSDHGTKKSYKKGIHESKNHKEINNIIIGNDTHINNTERNISGQFVPNIPVNNPKFSRIKWNRGMILTHDGIYDSIFMLDSGSDPNIIGSNILEKINLTPKKSSHTSSIISGGKITQVDTYIYLKLAINLGRKTYYIKNIRFNVVNTNRPNYANNKSFYFDKIILGDNILHELELNKKYPEIYPKFLQKEKNRNNDLVYSRKGVFDPEWDKKYLDNNLEIKNQYKENPKQNIENHNNEYMFLTQEEMKHVEEELNKQKQVNNPFVLSTDHKEGLEEYIIKNIEKLPLELQKYKEVFNTPPKGKIFKRDDVYNAKLPYNKEVVKKLPVQPHIKLNQDQEIALEKQFNELLEENKIEKCNTNHACNVFNVPKKDGTFRTVFNFVLVNNSLIPNQ